MGIDYETFGAYGSRSREVDYELDMVAPHLITRIAAPQAHPVPDKITHAYGPPGAAEEAWWIYQARSGSRHGAKVWRGVGPAYLA
jgi:hypothetical protein